MKLLSINHKYEAHLDSGPVLRVFTVTEFQIKVRQILHQYEDLYLFMERSIFSILGHSQKVLGVTVSIRFACRYRYCSLPRPRSIPSVRFLNLLNPIWRTCGDKDQVGLF